MLKKIRYKTVVYVFDFKLSWDVVPRPVDERMHLRKDGVPCTVSERAHCALHIGTFHALKEIFGYVSVICFFFFPMCTCAYFSKRFPIDEDPYWRVLKLL